MRKCKFNKGFSLIELLIVVAILGILSAVGILQYRGYQEQAKVNASKNKHDTVKKFISSSFANCSAGTGSVTMGTSTTACTASVTTFANDFATYFDTIDLNNPYDQGSGVTVGAAGTENGQTYLTVSGSYINVTTVISASETFTGSVLKE